MSALTMNPAIPHRKPLPGYSQQSPARQHDNHLNDYSHSRTRTSSSNVIPINVYPAPPAPGSLHPAMAAPQPPPQSSRRTLSNATSSTSSTNNQQPLQRLSTNSTGFANGQPTATPRRSGSSRSTGSASPTSYVALMRRQKATVWCDRAQHEDPRILAAQRAAKMRAAMEVAGGHNHAASGAKATASAGMVGGVRSKIRHHGAPKASTYNANMLGGAGVPMRLSATEVDQGDSDDESYQNSKYHSRNGSGRSSMGSGHRNLNGSTPPTHAYGEAMTGVPEEETPMPGRAPSDDYFAQPGGSGGSGGSVQREENFGGVGTLPESRKPDPVKSTQEDLRRRGSVDDRTMTMGGGRLFVANPDLSD